MSVTIAANIRDRYTHGGLGNRTTVSTVTGDSSYVNPGGYTITPAQLGMVNQVNHTTVTLKAPGASVVFAHYFPSTSALKLYTASGEVSNATDVSAVQVVITAWGT